MDPFDDLLRGVRGEGAVFTLSALSPRSALEIGSAPLTLCIPLRGEVTIASQPVRQGEAAVVRDLVGTVEAAKDATVLIGSYRTRGEVARRLLHTLPPIVVVPDDNDCSSMRGYLEAQLDACRPGRQVVLDRLLDWLLVCTLRDWFDQPHAVRPGWYLALGDDVAGPALRAMHAEPARPWTLASLATVAGASRTTLAKRFTEQVGEPPLAYLTSWRMALAEQLLADTTLTVASIARRVGYADAFSFSTAFKRAHGVSPTGYRSALPVDTVRQGGTISQVTCDITV
ncbi:AraC family transcriptional regulator [Nonomuraea dietziae]|uniref:AraC family transcriptional regulator n=1 Tax=Nonomuraea dietziae TaxID=65515 RepID=UPI0033E932AD